MDLSHSDEKNIIKKWDITISVMRGFVTNISHTTRGVNELNIKKLGLVCKKKVVQIHLFEQAW